MSVNEVDTPALILDLDAFEANLDLMASMAAKAGVAFTASNNAAWKAVPA